MKNLIVMLCLIATVLLTGCGNKNIENPDINKFESNNITVDNNEIATENENDVTETPIDPQRAKTSLTEEDLNNIEQTLAPIAYEYETWDSEAESIVNSWHFNTTEGGSNSLFIPEYTTMTNREIVSSWIDDGMIYTMTKITLQDGTELNVLYINEADSLLCRAISVENWNQTTLYSNFIYSGDTK